MPLLLVENELQGELWEGRDSMHSSWSPQFLILCLVHSKGSISILLSEWCFDYLMTKSHITLVEQGGRRGVCREEISMSDLCWRSRILTCTWEGCVTSSWGRAQPAVISHANSGLLRSLPSCLLQQLGSATVM